VYDSIRWRATEHNLVKEEQEMYIVLEGSIKVGKTTQIENLQTYLEDRLPKREIVVTREPGGTPIAEAIRKIVQGTDFSEEMDPTCEAHLYAASRAQSLRRVVEPALERGAIIIADRSFITSLVYQGCVRGLTIETALEINQKAVGALWPNVVLYLDLEVHKALERDQERAKARAQDDRWERETATFFEKVRKGYLQLAQLPGMQGIWKTIDADGTMDEVFARLVEALEPYWS
jgi:dTMP kinase